MSTVSQLRRKQPRSRTKHHPSRQVGVAVTSDSCWPTTVLTVLAGVRALIPGLVHRREGDENFDLFGHHDVMPHQHMGRPCRRRPITEFTAAAVDGSMCAEMLLSAEGGGEDGG